MCIFYGLPDRVPEIKESSTEFGEFQNDGLHLVKDIKSLIEHDRNPRAEVIVSERNQNGHPVKFFLCAHNVLLSCSPESIAYCYVKERDAYRVILTSKAGWHRYAYFPEWSYLVKNALEIVDLAENKKEQHSSQTSENHTMTVPNNNINGSDSVKVSPNALPDVIRAFRMSGMDCTVSKDDGNLVVYYAQKLPPSVSTNNPIEPANDAKHDLPTSKTLFIPMIIRLDGTIFDVGVSLVHETAEQELEKAWGKVPDIYKTTYRKVIREVTVEV